METDIKGMLSRISQDGYDWLCAKGVIVSPMDKGFTLFVDGREEGYYSSSREIIADIKEYQRERPFPMKEV